jgi:hypothetical protein
MNIAASGVVCDIAADDLKLRIEKILQTLKMDSKEEM